jgi:hypothetical protein
MPVMSRHCSFQTWRKQLIDEEAQKYTRKNIFGNWQL